MADKIVSNEVQEKFRQDEPAVLGWKFWIFWTLATFVGYAIGIIALSWLWGLNAVGFFAEGNYPLVVLLNILYGAVFGLVVGSAKELLIRRYLTQGRRWLTASLVSSALAFSVLLLPVVWSDYSGQYSLITAVCGTLIGTVVGFAQWLVIRSDVRQSGYWIPATAICGLLLSHPAIVTARLIAGYPDELYTEIFLLLIAAVISGTLIITLLRRQANTELQFNQ